MYIYTNLPLLCHGPSYILIFKLHRGLESESGYICIFLRSLAIKCGSSCPKYSKEFSFSILFLQIILLQNTNQTLSLQNGCSTGMMIDETSQYQ